MKENIKIKLEEISKKKNKSQIETISELIRDYELYKRTIFSILDDVKLMIKCFEILNASFTEGLRRCAKDESILTTNTGTHSYEVSDMEVVDQNDTEILEQSSNEEQLLIYTCYFFEWWSMNKQRYIIKNIKL